MATDPTLVAESTRTHEAVSSAATAATSNSSIGPARRSINDSVAGCGQPPLGDPHISEKTHGNRITTRNLVSLGANHDSDWLRPQPSYQ